MSENYDHNRTNRNKRHMHKNLTARTCVIGLDARKFSCAKISTFTVYFNIPKVDIHQSNVSQSKTMC